MQLRWTSCVIVVLAMALALLSEPASAAKVEKVKGKKVLVDSEGESLEAGQIFTVRDENDKAVGVIKITKVGRSRSVAVLGKGTAQPGQTLKLRAKQAKKEAVAKNSLRKTTPSGPKSYIGGMAGYSMSSADVDLFDATGTAAGSASLDGNGFSAKGLYDYPLFTSLWFRGLLGIEQFNVSGANSNACSGACETEIMYLTFDFWGRLLLSSGTTRPWIGAGGALLFPLSKSSSALKESSITNTNIFAFGGGVDFFLSDTTYLPIQVEYNMYPKSDTVDASAIALRGGFAMEF